MTSKQKTIKSLSKKIESLNKDDKLFDYLGVILALIERKRNDQALAYICSLEKEILEDVPEEVLKFLKYL